MRKNDRAALVKPTIAKIRYACFSEQSRLVALRQTIIEKIKHHISHTIVPMVAHVLLLNRSSRAGIATTDRALQALRPRQMVLVGTPRKAPARGQPASVGVLRR